MTQSIIATSNPPANKVRSIGSKFFLVLLLAAIMSIPGFFVSNLAEDRATARGAVTTQDSNGVVTQPHTLFGLRLADSYRSTQRSLKYITLVLGLVFLTYFLFEVTNRTRVHPGQYALVGVAQTVFYLLLLSVAERVGFDIAYLIAGSATVLLFSINAQWLFRSRRLGLRALAVFSVLYASIYMLLRMEDYALMIGAIASFIAIATTMYLTRNIDWYGIADAVTGTAANTSQPRESWLD